MYYARVDSFMLNKKEYGYGFANSKKAVAFDTKEERSDFLRSTYDLSAKVITRVQALKLCEFTNDPTLDVVFMENWRGLKKGVHLYKNLI